METEIKNKKYNMLTKIATIIASFGGLMLIITSIIGLLININLISMNKKLYMLLDGIFLGIIVALFIVAYVIYKVAKKKYYVNPESNKNTKK